MYYDKISQNEIQAGRRAFLDGWGGRLNLVVTKAKGAKFWDNQGKEYIDCWSQAFVLNLGHAHPKIVKAVKGQVDRFSHIAARYDTVPLLLLSKKIGEIAPGNLNKVNFCLEGSVAVEGAIKLAIKNRPGKERIITFDHGYHGRTLATIPASWTDPYNYFSFYTGHIVKVPEAYCYRCSFGLNYPSCGIRCADFLEETIEKRLSGRVAAVIMEPVQGNGGQITFPPEFHKRVREICTKHNVLLIWDEIQTAFGRVGKMFAAELYNVIPDIIVFGKAVAGGYPLAGIVCREDLKGFGIAEHGFTFAHFPLSLVAALTAIEIIEEDKLLERCTNLGHYITSRLKEMKKKYEMIGDVRGPGLALGVELVKDKLTKEPATQEANQILKLGMQKGVSFGITQYGGLGNVIKIKPPLVITDEEVNKVLSVFEECVKER